MGSFRFEKLIGNFDDDPVTLVAPRKGTNIRRNEYNESRATRSYMGRSQSAYMSAPGMGR